MSEQETSDELKAAAQRVAESIELAASGVSEGDALERTYNGDIDGFARDMTRLAVSTLERLDAEESERAERAKPIDAEWLKAIGFVLITDNHDIFEHSEIPIPGVFILDSSGILSWRQEVYDLGEFTTRGQLLDLIAALKGGASCESK